MCYHSCMKETYYGMTKVKDFLGITRQGAYARKNAEGWQECEEDKNGNLLIPSSVIKESRNLERRKLIERVDKLDVLNSRHQMSDVINAVQQEQEL